MSTMLEFSGASFSYSGREVLAEVGFALAPGECAALIGPNGIGKSTLLRIAAGIVLPSAGLVLLEGCDLKQMRRRAIARSIALVAQQVEVPFDFTVEQILGQGRTPYLSFFGGLTGADHDAIESAIEATDIGYLRYRIFNQLSGGERQRVKIALGLAQEPRLLLLDEPTQSLDIGRQLEMIELIRSLSQSGVTILAAMHDLGLIEGTFSSVLLLSPNQPMLTGKPADVLMPRILERAFNCPPQQGPTLLATEHLRSYRAI